MLAPTTLLFIYILCSGTPSGAEECTSTEFYKELYTPWDYKQTPWSDGCPTHGNYTWDYYFNYTLDMGVRNYRLLCYIISRESVLRTWDFFGPPWDKHGFMSFRRRVNSQGGRILADLQNFEFSSPHREGTFNKAVFVESVENFTKDYPVDGFVFGLPLRDPKYWKTGTIQAIKECFEAIKELKLVSGSRVEAAALGNIADLNFVDLAPSDPDFITDCYAKRAIKNATLAGVK
ncbi:hypothetical protein FOL46_001210, partial [Perkinsus olseni]